MAKTVVRSRALPNGKVQFILGYYKTPDRASMERFFGIERFLDGSISDPVFIETFRSPAVYASHKEAIEAGESLIS